MIFIHAFFIDLDEANDIYTRVFLIRDLDETTQLISIHVFLKETLAKVMISIHVFSIKPV